MFILTFLILVIAFIVFEGGYEGEERSRTSHTNTNSTKGPRIIPHLEGLPAYDTSHINEAAYPSVSASGWFVIPPASEAWMFEYHSSQSETSRLITNTIPEILECANSLLRLYSTDAHIEDSNATYIALMECKKAINNRLIESTGQDHPSLVPRSFHYHKLEVLKKETIETDQKDWTDQLEGCVHTYCAGTDYNKGNCDLADFLGGLGGPWQGCHLCHPRNSKERTEFPQIIRQHCKKMVARQWHAFYFLGGLIAASLLAASIAILVKNRRAAKRTSKQAWIEARIQARAAMRGLSLANSRTTGRSGAQSVLDPGNPKIGLRRRVYLFFGGKVACSDQEARTDMMRLNLDGQGLPNSATLVPVMPPAPNAKGRSSSFDVQAGLSTGTRAKQGLDGTSDVQRQHARSDPGPSKHAPLSESMPVTNQVFEYGLKGRLCTSDEVENSQEV